MYSISDIQQNIEQITLKLHKRQNKTLFFTKKITSRVSLENHFLNNQISNKKNNLRFLLRQIILILFVKIKPVIHIRRQEIKFFNSILNREPIAICRLY